MSDYEGEVNHDVTLMRANAAYPLRRLDRSNCAPITRIVDSRIPTLYLDIVFPSGIWHWPDEGEGAL